MPVIHPCTASHARFPYNSFTVAFKGILGLLSWSVTLYNPVDLVRTHTHTHSACVWAQCLVEAGQGRSRLNSYLSLRFTTVILNTDTEWFRTESCCLSVWLNKWHYWSENDVDFWLRHFFVLEVTTKQIPITRQSALRSWWIMTWYHSVLCSKSSYHTEWRCTSLSAGCRIEKLGEIGFCESVCELSTVKVFFIKGLIRSSITRSL